MSTNYYIKRKIPKRMLNHATVALRKQDWDELEYITNRIKKYQYIHIGHSSCGWKFCFQYLPFLGPKQSIERQDMIKFVKRMLKKGEELLDEYEQPVTISELINIIDSHQNGKAHNINPNYNFTSKEGYDFGIGEFS